MLVYGALKFVGVIVVFACVKFSVTVKVSFVGADVGASVGALLGTIVVFVGTDVGEPVFCIHLKMHKVHVGKDGNHMGKTQWL